MCVRDSASAGFIVTGEIPNAKKIKGTRLALYRAAQAHCAFHSVTDQFWKYDGDTLKFCLMFEEKDHALQFRYEMMMARSQHPLRAFEVKLHGLVMNQLPHDLKPVEIADYSGQDTDSPPATIDDALSVVSTDTANTVVHVSDQLFSHQSVEMKERFSSLLPYQLHLKSQAKFPKLANDPNNIIAGSWSPLHQYLDGMRVQPSMPLVLISGNATSESIMADGVKRYKVLLHFKCFNNNVFHELRGRMKNGSTEDNNTLTLTSFVHVLDPGAFLENVKWKHDDTKKTWDEYEKEEQERAKIVQAAGQ